MLGSRKSAISAVLLALAAVGCTDDDKGTETGDSSVTTPDAGADSGGGGEDEGTADLPLLPESETLPIVFVHGFAGSASQYESQAIRFVANGYPRERIVAFDHDGAGLDIEGFTDGVDEVVDKALADFNVDKVFLVGHSRGTFVSSTYLGDPERAAKVAKYISLDGSGCAAAETAGVPCDAPSQANLPGHKHVEVATSKESFARQFKFLLDREPEVVDIVKQKGDVKVSGRVVNFPANTGRAGTTLKFFEIDADTGARSGSAPVATYEIDESGEWGPAAVDADKHYELELTAAEGSVQHFYPQRFLRSSHLVRLLSGPPDADSRKNTNTGDGHAALIVMRMREWLPSDVLEISTESEAGDQPVTNVITEDNVTKPPMGPGGLVGAPIALYVHDDAATPGETTLAKLPWFPDQAFQTGMDVFMPAAEAPNGTISIKNLPRGETDKPQVINVPNWASSKHSIMLIFSDFPLP